ncbi:MAG: ABC transporter permease [Acidobacteria bacterium]|nr:ABC transporter permease [Acidobacteriota bacterium]
MKGVVARRLAKRLGVVILTVLGGGLICATMVRLAPGFDTDERELDSRLSADSQNQIRGERAGERNVKRFYVNFLANAMHGDLGESRTLNRPVLALLRERMPVTLRLVGIGLALAWAAGFSMAVTAAMARATAYDWLVTLAVSVCLSLPAAVLALLVVYWEKPAYLALGLAVLPKLYSYSRNLLIDNYKRLHILAARAKGIGPLRILLWHVLPVGAPELVALAGVSVSVAIGAAIPVEALCGIPGIGQLAWQAALGRDLPLLVTITVLVTLVTLIANAGADFVDGSNHQEAQ